jgi:hypothetical protein
MPCGRDFVNGAFPLFDSIAATIKTPQGYLPRTKALTILAAVRDGSLYDGLRYEFCDEQSSGGEYVPIKLRKPSVRYRLCQLVVEDSVSFLFGEGRWPAIECEHRPTQDALALVLTESRLAEAMCSAALEGSIGSVVVLFRVLGNRVFFDVKPTAMLTPDWKKDAPDILDTLTEKRMVLGSDLAAAGYAVDDADLSTSFWWQQQWTDVEETWFHPWRVIDTEIVPQRDPERSTPHGLGFVPAVWVRNLIGTSTGDPNDGACTFRAAIETAIEIDYQLSQAGRGLKYSSDPTLLIKEPAAPEGDIVRSASSAIIVSEKGDAKLLEINGTASAAVIEYVKTLRELALESVHGNRSSADKIAAAQSGRAMELLYAPLINLADRLRTSYGDAIVRLARMVVLARKKFQITAFGEIAPEMAANKRLTLRWPPYFAPTHQDRIAEANTLGTLRRDGMMSQETGVARTAETWDFIAADEMVRIKADEAAVDARAVSQAAAIQDTQALPA